jgi:PAS domain S-box-containing protein
MAPFDYKRAKILIVEDDRTSAYLIEKMLNKAGFTNIEIVESGEQALQIVRKMQFDLVLLDLMLPDISGIDVCERIKFVDSYEDVPISMISSIDNIDEQVKALEIGIEDFISKPIHEKEFIVKIKRQIKKRTVLEHTRLEKNELNALSNILNIDYSDLSLEQILEQISHEISTLLKSDRTTIFLKKGKHLISKTAEGFGRVPFILSIDEGIAGKVAREGEPIITNDVKQDKNHAKNIDKSTGYQTYRMLTHPIFHNYKIIGVIQTLNKATNYTERDLNMIQKISMYTASILARYYAEKQLKQSENFYRKMLDRLYNGVFIVDQNDKIIYANHSVLELVAYTKTEVIGKEAKLFFSRTDFMYLKELGSTINDIETHLLNKKFEFCPVKLSTRRIELDDNEWGIIYTVSDIRTTLQLEIKDVEIEAMKNELNSMVLHDLKSPLTSILGFADMLQSKIPGELSDKQSGFIQKIIEASERMLNMTSEVLEVSRLESGYVPLHLRKITINDVIGRVLDSQALFFKKRDIEYIEEKIELPEILGDYDKLYRMFTNLISNALKFTPVGGKIYINYKIKNYFLIIEVKDTGVGIPQENLSIVFNKFNQAENAEFIENKDNGTGLGLAICKLIVEAHHGDIYAESQLNKGTSIFVKLPIYQNEKSFNIQKSANKTLEKF